MSASKPRYLVFGNTGWIGGQLIALLEQQGAEVHGTNLRLHHQPQVSALLDELMPTHVFNCAGMTGRPNIDECEKEKPKCIMANLVGPIVLADECRLRGIHCNVLATGCIFHSTYNSTYTTLTSPAVLESDEPDFKGSFYSRCKANLEDVLRFYDNVLLLRLRMPVSDRWHPRNFVRKIHGYAKVVDIPNSHSIVDELLPVMIALSEHNETGIMNFTNPGALSHNEVLKLLRDHCMPGLTWENFTPEEQLEQQAKVVVAPRSNCHLDSSKLTDTVAGYKKEDGEKYGHLEVRPLREAYVECFKRMAVNEKDNPLFEEQKPGAEKVAMAS